MPHADASEKTVRFTRTVGDALRCNGIDKRDISPRSFIILRGNECLPGFAWIERRLKSLDVNRRRVLERLRFELLKGLNKRPRRHNGRVRTSGRSESRRLQHKL